MLPNNVVIKSIKAKNKIEEVTDMKFLNVEGETKGREGDIKTDGITLFSYILQFFLLTQSHQGGRKREG